jgi:hypothetical protein
MPTNCNQVLVQVQLSPTESTFNEVQPIPFRTATTSDEFQELELVHRYRKLFRKKDGLWISRLHLLWLKC